MSQGDVIALLKKNKNKWFTVKEISQTLKIGRPSVSESLLKLHSQNEVWKKYPKWKDYLNYPLTHKGLYCQWKYKC